MKVLLILLGVVAVVANANILSALEHRKALAQAHKKFPVVVADVTTAAPPVISCQACDDAVNLLNYLLKSPFILESLKQLLYTECTKLPEPYGEYCNETINGTFTLIVKFVTDMDAHLCSDVLHCTGVSQAAHLPNDLNKATVCQTFDHIIAHLPQFVAQLSSVCGQLGLPQPQQRVCEQLFVADTAIVARMAENVLVHLIRHTPFASCQLTNTYEKRGSVVVKTDVKSVGCEACKDAIDLLNTMLKSQLVEDALQSLLLELCKVLPTQYSSGCTSTVTQFIGAIMDFITDMTPHICDLISNCESLTLKAALSKESSVCEVFQEIYTELPKLLVDAEQICDKIPDANLSAGCHDFFKNDFADVLKMAQQVVQKLASEIPFLHCKVQVTAAVVPAKAEVKDVGCTACKDLVDIINTLLQSDFIKGSLEDLLKKLCADLPSPYSSGCTDTVSQFMDAIVKFITDMTNNICTSGFGCTKKMLTRESSICAVFDEIIANMPQFAKEAEGVCNEITDASLAQGCHQFFQTEQKYVVQMGDKLVESLAAEIPFLHCKFNTTTALVRG